MCDLEDLHQSVSKFCAGCAVLVAGNGNGAGSQSSFQSFGFCGAADVPQKHCTNLIEASRLTPLGGTGTNYTLAFLYPYGEDDGEDEGNKSSSVVWLDYMGMNALFMGDASDDVESLLLRDDKFGFLQKMGVDLDSIEILKVAHHGSGYSSSAAFLQYLGVQTAVVSCGKDNPYGHPSNRVINDLTAVGASVYRTDKDGHVIITISNNKTIETITLKD